MAEGRRLGLQVQRSERLITVQRPSFFQKKENQRSCEKSGGLTTARGQEMLTPENGLLRSVFARLQGVITHVNRTLESEQAQLAKLRQKYDYHEGNGAATSRLEKSDSFCYDRIVHETDDTLERDLQKVLASAVCPDVNIFDKKGAVLSRPSTTTSQMSDAPFITQQDESAQ